MKVFEIATGYTPIPAQMGAATEIVVEELTRAFINNGTDAEIIDIKVSDRKAVDLPIREVRVPSVFAGTDVSLGLVHKLKRVVYSISLANKLKKILKETNEKVVFHFHNQYNMFFFMKLVPKKLRKKAFTAYTVHSYIWGTEWEKIESDVKKKYFQEVACVRNADAVFVLNDITANHFVNRLNVKKERIHKVINGVNTNRYRKLDQKTRTQIKCENGLEGKKVIFQVGSVCDRKNQLGSVELLADFLKEHSDVVYVYAGGIIDSKYQSDIISRAKQYGISEQVKYLGESAPGEQLNRYYNMADCCIFTSTLESFGLVIIEAISSGIPVVMSDNLMFELKNGYCIYHSKEEFINAIDSILFGCMTFDGKEVCDKYNWNSVAETYSMYFDK